MPSSWLPTTIVNDPKVFESYEDYLSKIYSIFCIDLKNANVVFLEQKLKLRFNPVTLGKENAFWHLTQESDPSSEKKSEEDRLADFSRMERLCWISPMILAVSGTNKDKVLVWISTRPGPKTYLISLLDFSYVVIIEWRDGYCLLRSAYPVRSKRREKLKKEYDESEKVP